jgi:hypothetical protein
MNSEGSKTGSIVEVSSLIVDELLTNSVVKTAVESAVSFGAALAICITANTGV